ncbi:DUF2461 domain-containing protein [Bacilliculturomica massiliensis]|uniref:DUF2461 domain-containing protein n=1 Tax=Bacilliculturomica massiliensis TaxID=1917867 RepID=UPI00103008BF|nr:DUF2461 domain-containing protein [Bacilliculturomica massiliensis]
MSMQTVLEYLAALEQNNDREWYHEHRSLRTAANQDFEEFLRRLILEIREFDETIPLLEPRELTFKLVRDTRFSHDKSPYNPAFRAHISAKGKLPIPVGYYIMIRPGGKSFLGGGLFADMFKDATAMVRDHIAAHGGQWQKIITDPGFTRRFTVGGTALKNVPRGYDPGHPQAEYLKNKSWYLEYPVSDKQVWDEDFVSFAASVFSDMRPFNDYLNQALEGFQMP